MVLLWWILQYAGVDPLQAGNVVQLVLVLGLTVGWISTYIFRVSNKEMTYAQQLRDYENKVMEALFFVEFSSQICRSKVFICQKSCMMHIWHSFIYCDSDSFLIDFVCLFLDAYLVVSRKWLKKQNKTTYFFSFFLFSESWIALINKLVLKYSIQFSYIFIKNVKGSHSFHLVEKEFW